MNKFFRLLALSVLLIPSAVLAAGSPVTIVDPASGGAAAVTSGALSAVMAAGSAIIGKVTVLSVDNATQATLANPVPMQASSGVASGLTSVSSAAAESNHVLKASAGNLYGFEVTTGATPGFVFVSNTSTAPTAGGAAIAPVKCYQIAANTTIGVSYAPLPLALATGITIVFSTTGCFINTASATAFISGDAQ